MDPPAVENAFPRDSFTVQRSCLVGKTWYGWNFKQQLVCNLQNRIQVLDDRKSDHVLGCPWKWNSNRQQVVRLSFRQNCSTAAHRYQLVSISYCQVWCRWSLRRVQATIFYLFAFKVGSKRTWIILTSSGVKPSVIIDSLSPVISSKKISQLATYCNRRFFNGGGYFASLRARASSREPRASVCEPQKNPAKKSKNGHNALIWHLLHAGYFIYANTRGTFYQTAPTKGNRTLTILIPFPNFLH